MVRVDVHTGARAALRPLFEPAEDSRTELDGYLDDGVVLVAVEGEEVVGHLQLTALSAGSSNTGPPSEWPTRDAAGNAGSQRSVVSCNPSVSGGQTFAHAPAHVLAPGTSDSKETRCPALSAT